ncbi:DUF4089 domain-containing protein [Variovorax sp. J22P168]|uniref:AtzG-like protein n=1 Tax=Variovorax jilinensis TaxID=3053513 RepID=UPI00257889FD|nr:AtzG-like protein [Variovorax sp. J22P168]MDM0015082.1 DUF4089 domain-containing protein [Variovorax sp. J22P168]
MAERIPTSPSGDPLDTLLSASIDLFGLQVEEAWRSEACFFLNIVAQAARLVLAIDLGDDAEPAAVFRP